MTQPKQQRPRTMITAILAASHALLESNLAPQQRTFIQHITNTADQLLTLLDGVPQTDVALRHIIPALGDNFQQPQSVIYGYAKMLLESPQSFDGATLNDIQTTHARTIYDTGMALARITQKLHDDAFNERKSQRDAEPVDFDLNMLIWQHTPIYRYWIRNEAVQLTVNFPSGLPPIHGNPYHIAAITQHLITTIARDLLEYGKIELSAQLNTEKSRVELAIFGSGLHLLSDDLDILFKKNGRHVYRQRLDDQNGTLRIERDSGIGATLFLGWSLASRITS